MILYYSATGNSEYVAKRIQEITGDTICNLFDKLREKDYSAMESQSPWVIVAPTFAWQLPRFVRDWMKQVKFEGAKKMYFVLTCGNGVGNAEKYAKALAAELGMDFQGLEKVIMPENYIAMFAAPGKDEAKAIVVKAEASIDQIGQRIQAGLPLQPAKVNAASKMIGPMLNGGFYSLIIKDKKFYTTNECTSCGLCQKACPMKNISLIEGKVTWNGNCTHCMACICGCPTEAIEYGKASKNRVRYHFRKL